MAIPAPAPEGHVPATRVDNELIVDLRHLRLVKNGLTRDHVAFHDDAEENADLDLARITLAGQPDLDDVLRRLRHRFALDYGNWVPLMDTNCHVGHVLGMPTPESQGEKDPVPLARRPHAMKFTEAGARISVGVLDTRIFAHDDLAGRFDAEPDDRYKPRADAVPARAGHATFVTSLILHQAPAAMVVVRAVLNDDGVATAWDTAKVMMELRGVQVLNLSLGCRTTDGTPPLVFSRAVDRLNHATVIVAAAGNHGNSDDPLHQQPTWPAALPDVVAVGARDGDKTASFSPKLPWITCTAPGVQVEGAYLEGLVQTPHSKEREQNFSGYARWSGTSFATATTSGAIAAHVHREEDGHYVVTPHQALAQVLAKEHGVVRPYTECDDGDCA